MESRLLYQVRLPHWKKTIHYKCAFLKLFKIHTTAVGTIEILQKKMLDPTPFVFSTKFFRALSQLNITNTAYPRMFFNISILRNKIILTTKIKSRNLKFEI